jgi:hypothetical protein
VTFSLTLPLLIGCHGAVGVGEIALQHVRPGEVGQKAADPAFPDHRVQSRIDIIIDGDRQLFHHTPPP